MKYLGVEEVVLLHESLILQSGGSPGIRDAGLIDSAVQQPRATFGGVELYPTLVEKAAALACSLAKNHAFVDGNERIAHAAMEVFLVMNRYEIAAGVDEQEATILQLAAGSLDRNRLERWLESRIVPIDASEP